MKYTEYLLRKLFEIYYANLDNPEISRDTIKSLLSVYLQSKSIETSEKSITNWVGRFLSIIREVNLLIRKKNTDYILNFGGIFPRNHSFFWITCSIEKLFFF